MFVVTNYDYEEESVSEVHGTFPTAEAAEDRMKEMAVAEFQEIKEDHEDAEMFDDVKAEIEIVWSDGAYEGGCLYQVVGVEK